MSLTFSVADLTVHRIVELDAPFLPAREMLPGLTPEMLDENRHWLQPHSLDENDVFKLCYQSYIVRTPHHVILVDSCLGNHKPRPRPEWDMKTDSTYMRALAAVGLSVEDIDYVLCTHLHGDHVGWNTRLENGVWVPTFPNARYLFGQTELTAAEVADREKPNAAYQDSVLPVVRLGKAEIVAEDFSLGDHLRLMATPGHTDGHVAVCFGKSADHIVLTGDLIHVPLQMRYPELSFSRDKDLSLAAATRRGFLERFCDTETLCCTAHFPSPSAGRVLRWGDGYRLHSAD
ncbi:MBL fold metallo-hydrolase [Achromobacter piechaudii]|uniref:Putative quorum-quenching lactonase YtnP n=1 Tax=Achromobacter piechaudii TaxID=72556 RepID=A0A6S7CYQ8_9BURK|nr:MBL fold metallo-hydrolase [Achromobacter piechaudii]CAB3867988.1 putative quorum-quenching lactonase YtnP [Achromobacter piechaudii]